MTASAGRIGRYFGCNRPVSPSFASHWGRLVRPYYLPTDGSTVKVVWIDRFTIEMQATEMQATKGHPVKAPPGIRPVVRPDPKACRSNPSGPTEMCCGKPMPGTASCQAFGEWACIEDLPVRPRVTQQVCPQSPPASLGQI
jgi:hypothetical protein